MGDAPLGSVTTERGDGTVVLSVQGELDVNLSLPFVEALGDGDVDVEVDLSGVTFMDSAGVRLLLLTRSEVHASGRSWRLVAASPVAYHLLGVIGLTERFEVPVPDGGDPTFL